MKAVILVGGLGTRLERAGGLVIGLNRAVELLADLIEVAGKNGEPLVEFMPQPGH